MTSHAGDNSYSCALCDTEFILRNHIKRHIKIHTLIDRRQCDLYAKVLISWNHLSSDAVANSYPGAKCYKELISRNNLKKIIANHTGVI